MQKLYGMGVATELGNKIFGRHLTMWEGILMNPSGGLVGRGSAGWFIRGSLGVHGALHDADGFLFRVFGFGRGYGAWPHLGFFPGSGYSGQVFGVGSRAALHTMKNLDFIR